MMVDLPVLIRMITKNHEVGCDRSRGCPCQVRPRSPRGGEFYVELNVGQSVFRVLPA